jgi:hypothetical protein
MLSRAEGSSSGHSECKAPRYGTLESVYGTAQADSIVAVKNKSVPLQADYGDNGCVKTIAVN